MKRNPIPTMLFAAAALAGATAFAAEPMTSAPQAQAQRDMPAHHRMMQSDGAMGGGMTGGADMKGMMGGDGAKGMMCGGGGGGGGGMMGMMGPGRAMMGRMGGSAGGAANLPKLPAGNEKLEFQMHAEMMQKIGEIALKYADRVKEN